MFGLRELLDIQNLVVLDTRHGTRPQLCADLSELSANWVQAGQDESLRGHIPSEPFRSAEQASRRYV